jgi:glycosyltransferase involved in cell wall biosynthesis
MRSETGRVSVVLAESGKAVGGTERVVWELATRLPKSRFDVQVWLSTAPEVDEFAAALERSETAVRRLAEIDSRWDWRGMAATWQALRKARPELLHIHHVWPAADRYLSSLAAAAGVPRQVVTEHIVGRSHSPAQSALKRAELGRVDAITTVCGAVAESLVSDYGVARDRLRVVPNGADLPDEDAEEAPARRYRDAMGVGFMRPLWVCAARLEEQKGHDVLLDALAEVRRRGLEFVVALAGEGSLRASLEQRAAELGLTQQVHFLGQLEDVGPLLAAADTVVLPSRWEGLPLGLLEAMARARPVVASAVGGIPEVIEEGVNGRMVPAGNPVALADALEALHRKPDAALRMGRRAAASVRESYTWERVVEGFEGVYDEVLGLASFAPDPAPRKAGRGARR